MPASNHLFASFLSFLLSANFARTQTASPPSPVRTGDNVQHLDKFVVSAGHDPKTAFDVAQGTSVLAGEELHRLIQSTVGETLSSTPGVSSTYYGPGASRPVIRGLGGDRVRVLDNGIGTLDASTISPDHNTAIEPLFASRMEVLRGPSTLLYGSSAVGGVVNVIDNAVPDQAPDGRTHGDVEVRAGGAARETAGVASVGGGRGSFATRVNLLKQHTRDVAVPGFARIDAEAPPRQPRGTLPGSATDSQSGSIGGGYFWTQGRAGAALSRYESDYGVPTGETPATSIQMRRTRLDLEAEVNQATSFWRSVKARFGASRYHHAELSGGDTINTRFTNNAWEGRLELGHAPAGPVSGTIGIQAAQSDFAAAGAEVATPPSLTRSGALFALEELMLGRTTTVQLGARYEGQYIRLGEVPAGRPAVGGFSAQTGERKGHDGLSGSLGIVVHPAADWAIAASLALSERLPTNQELFSNGPHAGTRAYEIGNHALTRERSLGLDLSVRRRAGFVTGSIGAFINRFRNFIFEQELPAGTIPESWNEEGLTPYQFVATDARFVGGEAELRLHLMESDGRRLYFEFSSDRVRATETRTRRPLPRIPGTRHGARLGYEDGRWHALIELRHVEAQDRTAPDEAPTAAYTLVNASVSRLFPGPRLSWELFVRGRNLNNAEAREHTSFLKAFAPLPGRGFLAGVRLTF